MFIELKIWVSKKYCDLLCNKPFPNRLIYKWNSNFSTASGVANVCKCIKIFSFDIFRNKCYYCQYFNGIISLRKRVSQKFINTQIVRRLSESTQKKRNNVKEDLLMKFVPLRYVCELKKKIKHFFGKSFHPIDLDIVVFNKALLRI